MTRTVVAESYGGPEVLAVQDIDLPEPGRARYSSTCAPREPTRSTTSCTAATWARPRPRCRCRWAWRSPGSSPPTGSGAQGYTGALTVGDEVIATIVGGGYAERVLADASDVGHKPGSLSFEAGGRAASGRRHRVAPVDETRCGDGRHRADPRGERRRRTDGRTTGSGARGPGDRHRQPRATRSAACVRCRTRSHTVPGSPTGCAPSAASMPRSTWSALTRRWTRRSRWSPTGPGSRRSSDSRRAAELGIAALTGADGGQAIRDASRPELLRTGGRRQAGGDGGQGVSVRAGRRSRTGTCRRGTPAEKSYWFP